VKKKNLFSRVVIVKKTCKIQKDLTQRMKISGKNSFLLVLLKHVASLLSKLYYLGDISTTREGMRLGSQFLLLTKTQANTS
jgi:hypothetical protein